MTEGPATTSLGAGSESSFDDMVGETDPDTTALAWQRHLALGTTALAFAAIAPVLMALALARPWLVGLAAVPLVALASEVAAARPPRLVLETSVGARRVIEGDEVVVSIRLTSSESGLLLVRPVRSGGIEGDERSSAVDLIANREERLELRYVATRWGRGHVGLERVEWRTPLGLITWHAHIARIETVWVHPAPMQLRSNLGVSRTTARTGPHRSRARGSGIEYHSSRPFETGDRWRDLDHRAFARTGEAWTRTRHAERSRDLMVIVDLIEDGVDVADGPAIADRSLRAADGIVARHLADRDRVGVIVLGTRFLHVAPRDGRHQAHVILDRLMRAEGREPARVAMRRVDLRRRVPSAATVLVISPLFDNEIIEQIHSLRRHGRDVAVLHVGHDLVEARRDELNHSDRLAADLHKLRAQAVRTQLRADRIPVQPWGLDEAVSDAAEKMQMLHRATIRRSR